MDHMYALRVFVKVVESGSFARAAGRLEISAAVATRHLADLEAHLGTRLLNRTTRKLSMTEAGQHYLDRARHILQEVDNADASIIAAAKKPAGTLHVYSQLSFGESQLAGLLKQYTKEYPDVALDVTLSDRAPDIVDEGIDVGFFLSNQKFEATMIARQLGMAEIILCASPQYVREHGAPAMAEDLKKHACLNFAYENLRQWSLDGPEGTVDIPIKSNMVSNNGELLRQAALEGMGVVMRPSFSLRDDLSSGRLVRLLPGYRIGSIGVSMVYPSRRFVAAKVSSFVEFISKRYPHPERDPWSTASAMPSAA